MSDSVFMDFGHGFLLLICITLFLGVVGFMIAPPKACVSPQLCVRDANNNTVFDSKTGEELCFDLNALVKENIININWQFEAIRQNSIDTNYLYQRQEQIISWIQQQEQQKIEGGLK